MAPPILLIDLSPWNVVTDFRAIRRAGIAGVWIKVDEGLTVTDPDWRTWATRARAAGLRVGGYHFAHITNEPAAEAAAFARRLGRIGRRDLRPVLDLETGNPAAAAAWARRFLRRAHQLTGCGLLFYSYPAYVGEMHLAKPIGYGLWDADYAVNDGREHPYLVPLPWHKAVAHQFSSRFRLPGINGPVDITHAAELRPLLAHPIRGAIQ